VPTLENLKIVDLPSDDSDDEDLLLPPIGVLCVRNHDFTNLFEEYPKTHIGGHATHTTLPPEMLTTEKIDQLLKGMQYSLNNKKSQQ
jgi:hypothetical protein